MSSSSSLRTEYISFLGFKVLFFLMGIILIKILFYRQLILFQLFKDTSHLSSEAWFRKVLQLAEINGVFLFLLGWIEQVPYMTCAITSSTLILFINIINHNNGMSPCDVMAKVLNSSLEVSTFKLQLWYYVYFWTNILGKGMNFLITLLIVPLQFFYKDSCPVGWGCRIH